MNFANGFKMIKICRRIYDSTSLEFLGKGESGIELTIPSSLFLFYYSYPQFYKRWPNSGIICVNPSWKSIERHKLGKCIFFKLKLFLWRWRRWIKKIVTLSFKQHTTTRFGITYYAYLRTSLFLLNIRKLNQS